MTLATNALTTVATVNSDLGISGEDTYIERLINVASDFVERYCGRAFWRDTAIVEQVPGFGWSHLIVARAPINSITSIVRDGSTIPAADYESLGEDAAGGLIYRQGGWAWDAMRANDISNTPVAGTERRLHVVTYDGGWYTPKQDDDSSGANARALPYDIEEAAVEIVRQMYLAKKRDPGIASESMLGWSASYTAAQMSPRVRLILAGYRRL